MKARNLRFVVTASALFLLSGFQSVKADTVQAIASAINPYRNQQFYIYSNAPDASVRVLGTAT
jgi:hypothetical protein